jgi:phytoene dehydrogenase-like protein
MARAQEVEWMGAAGSGAYDAIVVGAGHNGLVAANLLADAGWSVLVLEAAAEPGGAVRTAEVAAPGYRSDLCSAFYPLGAASPVLRELELPRYGLRWRHAPLVLAHVLPDDRCAVLSRDLEETAASLDGFAAGDGEAWREELDGWARVREDVLDALLRPFPPVRAAARLLRRLGPGDALRLARLGLLGARRYGEERFAGDGGRLLVTGCALHADLSPDSAGSAVFGWLLCLLGQDVGFPVPEGGAARLVDALVARLTARGGGLACDTPVVEVVVRDGIALGVRTAGGERIRATRAVLADVVAPSLYLDLVGAEHLPARMVADLRRFQWDPATVKADWALSGPVPWTAEPVRRAGTVHLGADLDGLTRFAADLATGRDPEHPFLLLGQMTTADPSRSPAGTESVWAYTHVPHDPGRTADGVLAVVDRMERVIERHAPGFRDLVVGRYVQGPGDLERTNRGTVDGAINAGTAALHQELVFRPVPGLGRADTPIDRLYLAGASAHPGGGLHGACGANAARAALTRDRAGTGAVYAAGVRLAHRAVYRPAPPPAGPDGTVRHPRWRGQQP